MQRSWSGNRHRPRRRGIATTTRNRSTPTQARRRRGTGNRNGDAAPHYAQLGKEVHRFGSILDLPIELDASDGAEDVPAMITRLLDAHRTMIGKVRGGIETTDNSKDCGSNDLLMGDVLRRHEVWILAEHLVDLPLVED